MIIMLDQEQWLYQEQMDFWLKILEFIIMVAIQH
jgi:hypothetical protein